MFNFNTTPNLVIGEGSIKELDSILGRLGISKPLIITGPNISKTSIFTEVQKHMVYVAGVYNQVQAEPPVSCVHEAVEIATEVRADGIVAIGGGSPLDVAKIVAILADFNDPWFGKREIDSLWGVGNVVNNGLPLVAIPTTSGSGSEVTPVSILTTGETTKMGVVSPKIIPNAAILEPAFTVSCSPQLTAYSAIDAIVHAIEAYTSINPNNNPYSKLIAMEACRWLGKSIKTAILEPENIEARANVQYGAMLAGQAFGNSPVAAVHALAYPLGGHFKLPHGLTNTLVLPGVLAYNQKNTDYSALAAALFPHDQGEIFYHRSDEVEVICRNIKELAELAGIETQMRYHGISRDYIPILAKEAMKQTRLLVNNPREITRKVAEDIYLKVL